MFFNEKLMTYIPYLLRSEMIQIDPMLDMDWENRLVKIFSKLDEDLKIEIEKQILRPKQIVWNRISNTFETTAETSLQNLKFRIENLRMRAVVSNIIESMQLVNNYDNILFFSDYIENILHQMDQIEIGDDLKLFDEKLLVRKTFLYHIAKIIRKKSFVIPANLRNLSEDMVKNFIIEVYIKQQILGHWFRPLTTKEIHAEQNFFFKFFLIKQQKIRKFAVIKTSQFYFFIAPGRQVDENVYSIRRFLTEQNIEYKNVTYLFGLALPLEPPADPDFIRVFKILMDKMVTIEYRLNQTVVDMVANMDAGFQDEIIPLFIEPVMLTEKNLDLVVEQHLNNIEMLLTEKLLHPVKNAIKNYLSIQDEYDYVFHSLRNIFKEMLSYFEVFKQQPLLLFNQKVQEFGYRLLSYLLLIERRKDEVFVPLGRHDREFLQTRSQQPLDDLYQLINQKLSEYLEIQTELKAIEREYLKKPKQSFIASFISKKSTQTAKKEYNELYHVAMELKKKAYHDLLYIPTQYKKYCVKIQDENLLSIDGRETYYAFGNGEHGVGLLPILFHIKNDLTDFSIEKIHSSLSRNMTQASPFNTPNRDNHFIPS